MQTTTIIYLLAAILFSVAFSWLLYFYKSKALKKIDYLLFSLRATSIFLLLLLLINPSIARQELTNKKPMLSVLVDNSLSIQHFKSEKVATNFVNQIKNNSQINKKFEVQFFKFGEAISVLDSLSFSAHQTNIYKAISRVEALHKNTIAPVILISDGNQTTGNSYPFISTKKNIFPLIIGDTIAKSDVKIAQINVNKYSYLKNRFPVETRIVYDGIKNVKTQFTIQHRGKIIYRKNVAFSSSKTVETISTTIVSTEEGVQYYKASVAKIESEENVENNSNTFSVEVLNEQTKILLLTSFIHPDLGAIKKAIETNKQRSVTIENIKDFKGKLAEYQLVVLYQPTVQFETVFNSIEKEKANYFVITGENTNWNFLNEMQSNYYKNAINQSEEFGAIFNNGFLTFGQKEIGFESFPPLNNAFGSINMTSKFDALLFQNIAGFQTQTPLLATFENDSQKSAVLFGEGIWKWRAASFINSGSFQDFDKFLANMVQYLASTKKRERLSLKYDALHPANTPIAINAFYVDKNYQFDARAKLNLKLTNTVTNVSQNVPFSLLNNSFEAVLNELPSGDYRFEVTVENQPVRKTGQFKITTYQIEEQFTSANQKELKLLANNTEGKSYFPRNNQQIINDLIADKRYVTTQKSTIIHQQLIDWKLILALSILFFTVEWFIRKYIGKI
ncbi:VWA domain-containing protein [Polaribacter huanghezhanensis]|uniref:VWA domain-containing protein n=1 Tax=Polaribacter huanghezhanensis TaxID=1354726 RepID=UPI002649075F|nr:VWA domain-containing protein [Polaribacter huanghezhanensis]